MSAGLAAKIDQLHILVADTPMTPKIVVGQIELDSSPTHPIVQVPVSLGMELALRVNGTGSVHGTIKAGGVYDVPTTTGIDLALQLPLSLQASLRMKVETCGPNRPANEYGYQLSVDAASIDLFEISFDEAASYIDVQPISVDLGAFGVLQPYGGEALGPIVYGEANNIISFLRPKLLDLANSVLAGAVVPALDTGCILQTVPKELGTVPCTGQSTTGVCYGPVTAAGF